MASSVYTKEILGKNGFGRGKHMEGLQKNARRMLPLS